jgi:hypothetical protein
MTSRFKAALIAVAAAAVIPWGSSQAVAAPDQGNALGKKSEWTAPAKEARDLLIQTIGDDLPANPYCLRSLQRLDLMINSSDFVWPSTLTILGETVTVDINNLDLKVGPYADPSRRIWYRSGNWLAWRAAVFAEAGQTAEATTAARALLTAINANPDPGITTPEELPLLSDVGWEHSSAFRRSEALLCLTAVLPVAELEPAIRMHAAAIQDPLRYPGPPSRKPHNKGLLTNLHLLDVADVLQDSSFRDAAVARMTAEFGAVFSGGGYSIEGSSHYHGVNYLGWTDAMFALQNIGRTAESTALANQLPKVLDVAAHFISPTGQPLLYGNTRASDALLRPETDATRPLRILDEDAGAAVGRSSWTSKRATAWSAFNRPDPGSHGHRDELAVTWQTAGLPILVDVGQPRYDKSPETVWSEGRSAHNTVVAAGQEKFAYQKGNIRHRGIKGADLVSMTRETRDTTTQRQALFDDRRRTLVVADSSDRRLTQFWHFDPSWKAGPVSGNTLQLTHSSGQKLQVTTSKNAKITVSYGSTDPIGGWYATDFDQLVPATQLMITGGKAIDTQFALADSAVPAGAKMARRGSEMNGKLGFQWKLSKNGKAAAKAKATKLVSYRLQLQRKGELWRTIDIDSPASKLQHVVPALTNGEKYRFRVAGLAKKSQTLFSKPTKWAIPHTTPQEIAMKLGRLKGEGAKQKAQLKWLAPENDGGAKVTGYEVKLKKGDWQRNKRTSTKILMPKKRQVLWIRAVNRAGAGEAFKVKLKRNADGILLVNGVNLAPQPPPEPTAPPATPVPDPNAPAPAPPPAA